MMKDFLSLLKSKRTSKMRAKLLLKLTFAFVWFLVSGSVVKSDEMQEKGQQLRLRFRLFTNIFFLFSFLPKYKSF